MNWKKFDKQSKKQFSTKPNAAFEKSDFTDSDLKDCLLELIRINTEIKNCLTVLVGDPEAPCPECDSPEEVCGVSAFLTYAQAQFTINSVLIGGEDVSAKFTGLPLGGNTLPGLSQFKDELTACLEDRGYAVAEIQGRDGWTLEYEGDAVDVITDPPATIPVNVECN